MGKGGSVGVGYTTSYQQLPSRDPHPTAGTYRRLIGILLGIADMVRGKLDGPLVEGGQEGLGKGDFAHDVTLEAGVETVVLEVRQFAGCWDVPSGRGVRDLRERCVGDGREQIGVCQET